ncbi:MAG: transcription termination/antitermination protein NusG [Chloroflexi bacterium]|nr:transcription termination/antitermination protein NusG [Chloroflexota bacterium]|tara:strand:- start:1772 stop:2389 length:618 start_codon:yes stop_codon:yes gene_type:complete
MNEENILQDEIETVDLNNDAEDTSINNDDTSWYIVQTYSGHEKKVKANLEQRIKSMDMSSKIFQVIIPTQNEIEIREGQKKTITKNLFPGYVLVNMELDDSSWYVVRNTPAVTGFAGENLEEKAQPTPLDPNEIDKILSQMEHKPTQIKVGFEVGDAVRVTSGPFSEFIGNVEAINTDKGLVKVMLSMFGRETPVELDFLQVEKQ